jgi:hypothetical protein
MPFVLNSYANKFLIVNNNNNKKVREDLDLISSPFMVIVLGVFYVGSFGLRLWWIVLDLVCKSRSLVLSTLDLIVFFGLGMSSEGMSMMPCSSAATCRDFVLFFIFCLSWPSG